MVKQRSMEEWNALYIKIKQDYDPALCLSLFILFIFCLMSIIWVPLAVVILIKAALEGCPWVSITNSACSSCAIEEIISLIQAHSQITE